MAPPTGPRVRGRNAASSPYSRNSTTSTTARGGVSKRGRALRADHDGDLDMGATSNTKTPTGPSSRRANARSSGSRTSARLQRNVNRHLDGDMAQVPRGPRPPISNTTLKVQGLKSSKAATNADGGLKSLVDFLEKKALQVKVNDAGKRKIRGTQRPVLIKKSHVDGDFVFVLTSTQDAEHMLKVNGFSFAGVSISVTKNEDGWPVADEQDPAMSTEALQLRQKLAGVLATRYDLELTLLNLNALGTDPVLIEMGLLSTTPAMAVKTFKVLMKLCNDQFKTRREKREAVQSVTLADNSLESLDAVYDLSDTFYDLKHLDLSRNQISSMKQLIKWRGRFKQLETLLLNDNPIVLAEPGYAMESLTWFPNLQNLSGIQVRTPEKILEAERKQHIKEIPQRDNNFRDINGLGQDFITKFYAMIDSDRDSLLQNYYDEHSNFTVAVVNDASKDNDTVVPPWAANLGFSRSQRKTSKFEARFERHCTGAQIQETWQKLPATQHPALDTNKYLIDGHPLTRLEGPTLQKEEGELGMVITMHGEFTELQGDGKTGIRRFSRTFILGPSLTGRAPIRVMDDVFTLYAYSPVSDVAVPAPEVVSTTLAVSAPISEQQQQAMIAELSNQTTMTPMYSALCLESASWDFSRALAVFDEKKSTLPGDAFIQL